MASFRVKSCSIFISFIIVLLVKVETQVVTDRILMSFKYLSGLINNNKDGMSIKTRYQNMDLSVGQRYLETRYLLFASKNVSDEYQVKLDFSGQSSIGLSQSPDIGFETVCLQCFNEDVDCLISVNKCVETMSQYWTVNIKQNQIDWNERKVYFSIYSKLYPDKCLTAVTGNCNEYKLKIEGSYLKKFIKFIKGIISYTSLQILKLCKLNTGISDSIIEKKLETDKIFVFKLMDCNASDEQSFYFDQNYEDLFNQFNDFDVELNREEL